MMTRMNSIEVPCIYKYFINVPGLYMTMPYRMTNIYLRDAAYRRQVAKNLRA